MKKFFEMSWNIKFHENPSNDSRVDPYVTYGHDESDGLLLLQALNLI